MFGMTTHAADAETSFESKPTRTHLLELFTSEGCSSCPPAEAWLNKLKNEPRLWQDFVPMAFHIDYWDRLGWRDPFASKAWTSRQYQYSAAWKSGSVYTPALVLNGREWRERSVPAAAPDAAGVLKCKVAATGEVVAQFRPVENAPRDLDVHVARLGFGLSTNVRAGENSGRKLRHDFVVLSLDSAPMTSGKAQLKLRPDVKANAGAIAVWVTARGSLEPIQAAGGWLR
jgi:hypothetical protein